MENNKTMASAAQRMKIAVITAGYATENLARNEARILVDNSEQTGKIIKAALNQYLKDPRTFNQRIDAAKLDHVDPSINEKNFPILFLERSRDDYDLEILHFGQAVNATEALKHINNEGLDPADIADLLEYAEKNLREDWGCMNGIGPIIALGSRWFDNFRGRYMLATLSSQPIMRRWLHIIEHSCCGNNYLVRRKKSISFKQECKCKS